MSNSFHDQLVAARDKKHSKNHPFFELWAQGKLTKEQMAFYCTQHFHFVAQFLNWLAYQGVADRAARREKLLVRESRR